MSTHQPYFAYIRVSTAKQGEKGVSLQEQRAAIERYAIRNSLEISEWFEERVTAAKRGRPVFATMLRGLRRGRAAGVVIHKIDRGARNLKDWADIGELIDQGVNIHFAAESLDLKSRGGRLSADIQAVVAADYIRNLREETRKGFYGRLKQGLYPLPAPIGYIDRGKGRVKELDSERGPLVAHLFRSYASGEYTIKDLVITAKKIGLTNRRNSAVSINGIWTILRNPFYTGLIRIQTTGEVFKGVHEPLISTDLFNAVQRVLDGKSNARTIKHDFLFRRLFNCRSCGYALIGERQKGHVYYRCHTSDCGTKSVREQEIEREIRVLLDPLSFLSDHVSDITMEIEKYRSQIIEETDLFARTLALRLEKTGAKMDRLVDAFLDLKITDDIFKRRKEKLLFEERSIEDELNAIRTKPTYVVDKAEGFLERATRALSTYDSGLPEEKREMLEIVTSNRQVDGRKVLVELGYPFVDIAKQAQMACSDPFRNGPRTCRDIVAGVVNFVRRQDEEGR